MRIKTKYPGVYYRMVDRVGKGKGQEKAYYAVFKKQGKFNECLAGYEFRNDMTPARAARYRAALIEGRALTPVESRREALRASNTWTLSALHENYHEMNQTKSAYSVSLLFKNYILKPLGDKEPSQIVPLDIDRLRIGLLKKLAPETTRHVLEYVRRLCRYGFKKGLCAGLAFTITMPVSNNITTEDLTGEELKALLQSIADDENKSIGNLMKMALYTGMRRGELLKLKWVDVDFERGFIVIRAPKNGVDQRIPLNDSARAVLLQQPKQGEIIFSGNLDLLRTCQRIRNRAGLPKSFRPLHGLRHTFASALASSGKVDLYTLQKLLTHKTPSMTQRYAHLRDESLRQASNLMSDIVQEAVEKKETNQLIKI